MTNSLRKERAGLCASRAFVIYIARVDVCPSFPLSVGGWLRHVIVALHSVNLFTLLALKKGLSQRF